MVDAGGRRVQEEAGVVWVVVIVGSGGDLVVEIMVFVRRANDWFAELFWLVADCYGDM